jgi:hypothetical protein
MRPFADRQATGGAHTPSRGPVALYLGKLAARAGIASWFTARQQQD